MAECTGCAQVSMIGDEYCRSCGFELPDEEVVTCDCEAIVADNDSFCHDCGQGLSDENECASCGTNFVEDLDNCPGCGVSMLEDEEDDDGEYETDEGTDGDGELNRGGEAPAPSTPDVPNFG